MSEITIPETQVPIGSESVDGILLRHQLVHNSPVFLLRSSLPSTFFTTSTDTVT
jgi:hypothetical protein